MLRALYQVAAGCGQKNITPHSLRHSYATHLIEAGVGLLEVQKILAHHSILTTNRYTRLISHTAEHSGERINGLMNSFTLHWGDGAVIALAELIERFEPALVQRHGPRLLPSQHQGLAAMKHCRTRFAPRMLAQRAACGDQRSVRHSCGHRACPHCQHHDSQVWLQRTGPQELPDQLEVALSIPGGPRAAV